MIKNDKYAKYVPAATISNSKSFMLGKIFHTAQHHIKNYDLCKIYSAFYGISGLQTKSRKMGTRNCDLDFVSRRVFAGDGHKMLFMC